MSFPPHIPGYRWLALLVAACAMVWIALEGDLLQVVFLSVGVTVVSLGYLLQKYLAGRVLPVGWGLLVTAVLGALAGGGIVVLTLLFMALKTGLHAHGPEFSAAELSWVVQQAPLWIVVGLLAGLGCGLLMAASTKRQT